MKIIFVTAVACMALSACNGKIQVGGMTDQEAKEQAAHACPKGYSEVDMRRSDGDGDHIMTIKCSG